MQDMTYAQAVKEAETFLADHGIADAPVDAWLLFSYVTGISRAMFLAERMREMPQEQYERYRIWLYCDQSGKALRRTAGGRG